MQPKGGLYKTSQSLKVKKKFNLGLTSAHRRLKPSIFHLLLLWYRTVHNFFWVLFCFFSFLSLPLGVLRNLADA